MQNENQLPPLPHEVSRHPPKGQRIDLSSCLRIQLLKRVRPMDSTAPLGNLSRDTVGALFVGEASVNVTGNATWRIRLQCVAAGVHDTATSGSNGVGCDYGWVAGRGFARWRR
jgi:hypothetical protein